MDGYIRTDEDQALDDLLGVHVNYLECEMIAVNTVEVQEFCIPELDDHWVEVLLQDLDYIMSKEEQGGLTDKTEIFDEDEICENSNMWGITLTGRTNGRNFLEVQEIFDDESYETNAFLSRQTYLIPAFMKMNALIEVMEFVRLENLIEMMENLSLDGG